MLRRHVRWLALAALLGLRPGGASAQELPDPEHQIEAVFLFHFAQFVAWPPGAFDDARASLVIGVLGEDPFGEYLDRVVLGETVGGRSLNVRRFRHVDEVDRCHILFVGREAGEQPERILPRLRGRPILTVSDAEDFARDGGIIEFFQESNKIRFRINVDAARAANLTISSKLLRLADIVRAAGD